MDRNRNCVYSEQPHSFGIAHTDRFSVRKFDLRKWNAFAQNTSFLIRGPFGRQRQELLQLVESCLSIHYAPGKAKIWPETQKNEFPETTCPGETTTARRATRTRCRLRRTTRQGRSQGLAELSRPSACHTRCREGYCRYYKEANPS